MKKIITTLTLAVFSCFFSNAQDKVGINTADPDETLHVIGDIILLESPNGTKKVMLRTGGTSGELKSLGDLYIRGQNADVLINHVGTDGNVGINTATPMEELDVNGAIRINNTTSNNIGTIRFNTDLEDFEGYDGTAWKSLTSGGGGVWTEDGSKVYYLGSVGINTTSPNADLHIVGDTLLLESPDGTKNLLLRNAGADSEVKSIGDLYIRGQGNDVLINHVGTDGNVGIGTATPSEQLEVAGAIEISNTTNMAPDPGTIKFESGDFQGFDGTEWKSFINSESHWVENGGDLHYLNGEIGIGINTPSSLMHVVGDGSETEVVDFTSGSLIANNDLLNLKVDAGSHDDSQIIEAKRGSAVAFEVNANGDTRIGAASQLEKLNVNGAINLKSTILDNAGTIRYNGDFEGYDGDEWKSLTAKEEYWNASGNDIFYTNGNVGIGTNSPDSKLHINGDLQLGSIANKMIQAKFSLDGSSDDSRIDLFDTAENNRISLTTGGFDPGNGISSSTALSLRNFDGSSLISLNMDAPFNNPAISLNKDSEKKIRLASNDVYDGTNDSGGSRIRLYDYAQNNTVSIKGDENRSGVIDLYTGNIAAASAKVNLHDNNDAKRISMLGDDGIIKFFNGSDPVLNETIRLDSDHNDAGLVYVIGTNASGLPLANIVLRGKESATEGGELTLRNYDGDQSILMESDLHARFKMYGRDVANDLEENVFITAKESATEGAQVILRNYAGDEAIILETNSGQDSRIITDELEIRGGSDFAEHFDIIGEAIKPIPGMVVSIDPNSTGKLTICDEAYDKKVAGIISGANGVETGLFMGQKGSIADGDYPVALTGRVYVYANEEGGKITPGDLLTTSSTSGYAMKVKDYTKAQGAIIGKAMTTVGENGFVLVLVNLQ